MDIDLAGFLIACLGVVAGCVSFGTAVAEYDACRVSKVNGATLLSAKSQAIKAFFLVIGQGFMVTRLSQVALSPFSQLSVEAFGSTVFVALVTVIDFYYHRALDRKVRPQSLMRRRASD